MPRPRPEVLEISPYVGGISTLAGIEHPIKLSSNEGAFGVPPAALAALESVAADAHRYPDGAATALRAAIGRHFDLDPELIVCGAGSDDLIYLLCVAYGGPGTELIMTEHGFSIYQIAGRYAGCDVVKVPERALTADIDAILAALTPRTRLVFLANPNNPTATMLDAAEIARLHAGLPGDVLLVLDAAYAEYVEDPAYEPGAALVPRADNVVMTRTFSKIFGMGGLRLGWCYAPPAVVDVLNRVRSPFNCSVPAQAAGIAALAQPDWVARSRDHNMRWRAWLAARLRAAGLNPLPSVTNFLLVDLATPARAAAANRHLMERGLIVRGVGTYGLPQCLRVTIGQEPAMRAVADAFESFQDRAGG